MFDQHVIETPENISFDYQVAGIGSRFLAVFVDSLIQGALYLFLYFVYFRLVNVKMDERGLFCKRVHFACGPVVQPCAKNQQKG